LLNFSKKPLGWLYSFSLASYYLLKLTAYNFSTAKKAKTFY